MNFIKRWFIEGRIRKMLSGYKTYLSGVGLMFTGGSMMVNALLKIIDGHGGIEDIQEGFLIFMNGLGIFGLKHAVSKGAGVK